MDNKEPKISIWFTMNRQSNNLDGGGDLDTSIDYALDSSITSSLSESIKRDVTVGYNVGKSNLADIVY